MDFTNNDGVVPHNFAVYETTAAANAIYKGDFVGGGKATKYEFTAPSKPGTYIFTCDAHRSIMKGDFIVTAQ